MPKSKLEIIKEVVEQQQCKKINVLLGTTRKRVLLDLQTANLLLKMFNKAPQENIKKIEQLPWDRLFSMVWKIAYA